LTGHINKDSKQTEIIWSPALSLPSRAAAPPSTTLEMNTDYNNISMDMNRQNIAERPDLWNFQQCTQQKL